MARKPVTRNQIDLYQVKTDYRIRLVGIFWPPTPHVVAGAICMVVAWTVYLCWFFVAMRRRGG